MNRRIRVVDLFAGCGGLGLGFELHKGALEFDLQLAIDNDPAPLRVLNANRPDRPGRLPIGRRCDVTWFSDANEILLYYLVHLAFAKNDDEVERILLGEGFDLAGFLSEVRSVDESFKTDLERTRTSEKFRNALGDLAADVNKTAICSAFFTRLGFNLLESEPIAASLLPWRDEALALLDGVKVCEHPDSKPEKPIVEALGLLWDREIEKLKDAAKRSAWGQQRVVPARVKSFVAFLESPVGQELRMLWNRWRALRDSIRFQYCSRVATRVEELYQERRVGLLLGGPPCKGFSRVGRPKVAALREQGSYSWACNEYGSEHNALMYKYVLFLGAFRPDAFLFENVSNFQSALKTENGSLDAPALLAEAIEKLSEDRLHYVIDAKVLTASRYGVPQRRKRYILVGCNAASSSPDAAEQFFQFSESEHEVPLIAALNGLDRPGEFIPGAGNGITTAHEVQVVDATSPNPVERRFMEWIRQNDLSGKASAKTDGHIYRRLRADDVSLLKKFGPGQRWMDYQVRDSKTLEDLRKALTALDTLLGSQKKASLSIARSDVRRLRERVNSGLALRLLIEQFELPLTGTDDNHLLSGPYLERGPKLHGDWFERLAANEPCKTIVAHVGKDTYGYFHPFENRGLSIRECARVQSFPDWYKFGGAGVVVGYGMIGNAVPPLLAHIFAERFAALFVANQLFCPIPSGEARPGNKTKRKQLALID